MPPSLQQPDLTPPPDVPQKSSKAFLIASIITLVVFCVVTLMLWKFDVLNFQNSNTTPPASNSITYNNQLFGFSFQYSPKLQVRQNFPRPPITAEESPEFGVIAVEGLGTYLHIRANKTPESTSTCLSIPTDKRLGEVSNVASTSIDGISFLSFVSSSHHPTTDPNREDYFIARVYLTLYNNTCYQIIMGGYPQSSNRLDVPTEYEQLIQSFRLK